MSSFSPKETLFEYLIELPFYKWYKPLKYGLLLHTKLININFLNFNLSLKSATEPIHYLQATK